MKINFDDHFMIRSVGHGVYRAFNKKTLKPVSPIYSDPNAAQYFVEKEVMAKMDKQIEKMLGVDDGTKTGNSNS